MARLRWRSSFDVILIKNGIEEKHSRSSWVELWALRITSIGYTVKAALCSVQIKQYVASNITGRVHDMQSLKPSKPSEFADFRIMMQMHLFSHHFHNDDDDDRSDGVNCFFRFHLKYIQAYKLTYTRSSCKLFLISYFLLTDDTNRLLLFGFCPIPMQNNENMKLRTWFTESFVI